MFIQARILRNDVSAADRNPPVPTARDLLQRERIGDLGRTLMARYGRHAISMAAFAIAVGHGAAGIRRHFPDLDALLAHLLQTHLAGIAQALGEAMPGDEQCRQQRLRAAYLAATRTPLGGLTEAHLLLVRDRHLLPDDELAPIEDTLCGLGFVLAGEHGAGALALLDTPLFDAAHIEPMLAALREADLSQASGHEPVPPAAAPGATAIIPPASPAAPRHRDGQRAAWHSPARVPDTRHDIRYGLSRKTAFSNTS